MIWLGEREVGFDLNAIGFPSIDGCHAVVLLTDTGMWGFHNFGGSGASSFAERSQSFAAFVSQHFLTRGVAKHLYGTSFHNKRGWAGADKLAAWKDEMKAYAAALPYTGKVSGYNLDKMGYGAKSAYVEYRRNGNDCDVFCRAWTDMTHDKELLTDRVNHRRALSGGVQGMPQGGQVYANLKTKDGSALHAIGKHELDSFSV